MKEKNTKKIHWTMCLECHGQGKTTRKPSKKKRRIYQAELAICNAKNDEKISSKPINKNMDMCLVCAGSGLVKSDFDPKINSNYPHLAIIGAGIGGAALAVACLHRGIPFTLYERDDSFNARSQGYGLTLQQASKAIEALGIFNLKGGIISTRHVVHNSEGKMIGEWGLRKWKKTRIEKNSKRKNIHIARQSLRLALAEQLYNNTSFKWGSTLIDFLKNKNETININFYKNGEIKTAIADLVVGADGIRSSVRGLLIDEHETPLEYLGCIVILGICSLKSLADVENPLLDSETVFQTVNGHERIYIMPYDKNTIMWQLSFPMSEINAKELSFSGAKVMKKEALKRLDTWHEPIPQILAATLDSDITGYPVYDRKLLDSRLLSEKGNITLIGDAAHPMSPFKGQGANQALLDALNLARAITTECGPDSQWREIGLRKKVLDTFEKEMLHRTASKVLDSAKAVHMLHSAAVLHAGDEPRGRGLKVNSE